MDKVEIKDISGNLLLTTSIGEGSKRKFLLMKEDYITLKFSLEEPVHFKPGDYVDDARFGLFELCDLQKPTYNTSTGGYDYELRLDAYYWKWKNKIFKYTPESAGQEASWNLTAPLDAQLGVFLRNLKALGYACGGQDFDFSIDGTVADKALLMSYDNTNLIDALSRMAETWDCEWWVNGNQICFGRCEQGEPVDFEIGVNVEEMTRSDARTDYATRIYAFGSTRNLPAGYRPVDESVVVNGVVQRRLMLPVGTPYIDAYPNMRTEEAIEQIVIFDDIYPRRIGTISGITTHGYTDKIEEEGKEPVYRKWNAYRFKDTGITFSKDYILPGEELKITFQSGKLNGMTFAVTFNPCDKEGGETPIPEKLEDGSWNPAAQVWEIVRNEDYGRQLPSDVLIPRNGDTYVLSGFDTQFVSVRMLPDAENELKERAQKYIARAQTDPSTYENRMMPGAAYSWDGLHRLLEAGDRVNLINKAFFDTGSRQSRIIGLEYNLDLPYDHPVYTVGETASYSRIGELEEKLDSLTLAGQAYAGGSGSGIYVIRTNDSTPAGNSNVFSALRSLATFLCKNRPDRTDYLLQFGDFIDSLTAGKGAGIYPDGRMQLDRLEVRGSMTVMDLIINEIHAMAGEFNFSDCGKIEKVEFISGGAYRLVMEKSTETDFTNFEEGDVLYSIVNNLRAGGTDYYTSWFRCLARNANDNAVTVVLYPDSEVPGGRNYPPAAGYNVTRRGNSMLPQGDGANLRAQSWLLSSREGRMMFLSNVYKPLLEDYNYALTIGKLPAIKALENLPVTTDDVGIVAQTVIAEKIYQFDWNGDVIPAKVDRGEWSLAVAQGSHPYRFVQHAREYPDGVHRYTQLEQHTVYHHGCKWGCLIDRTQEEPMWNSPGWQMLEGDGNYHLDFESSNGWQFFSRQVETDITAVVSYGNRDITNVLMTSSGVEVEWLRDTGNAPSDNTWKPTHVDGQRHVIRLCLADMGSEWSISVRKVKFICRVFIPVGEGFETVENYVGLKI